MIIDDMTVINDLLKNKDGNILRLYRIRNDLIDWYKKSRVEATLCDS